MGLLGRRKGKTRAGLFMFSGVMQYVVLSGAPGNYKLEHCLEMPLDMGGAQADLFSDPEKLEANLKRMRQMAGGKWAPEVIVGIQSRDVLIRTVEMPVMDLKETKNAFRFDFDKFFPLPVDEATYDLSPIDYPSAADAQSNSHYLAAATRTRSMENLLNTAKSAGLNVACVEPGSVAAVRCMMGPIPPQGGSLCVIAGAASSIAVVCHNDNGVIYRNIGQAFAVEEITPAFIETFSRDIQSTLNFAAAQLWNFSCSAILIAGYGAMHASMIKQSVEEFTSLPVAIINPWELWGVKNPPQQTFGFEIPMGLALRA